MKARYFIAEEVDNVGRILDRRVVLALVEFDGKAFLAEEPEGFSLSMSIRKAEDRAKEKAHAVSEQATRKEAGASGGGSVAQHDAA